MGVLILCMTKMNKANQKAHTVLFVRETPGVKLCVNYLKSFKHVKVLNYAQRIID